MAAQARQRESAGNAAVKIVWRPQAGPQYAFVECPYFDVLFGGARGGGKSDGCLGEFALHAKQYGPAARGVFMRREMPQADSLIDRSQEIFGRMGWVYQKVDRQWTSPRGSILRFRPLEDDRDAEKYQGQDFTRVYLEEMTNWPTSRAPDKMKATLRSARGVPCRFRATANPGGLGHHWVKDRYVDPAPLGRVPLMDESGRLERMFIPARVTDNLILLKSDPHYIERLKLSGSKELVKAWLEGDWAVIEGAYFPEFSMLRHVVRPVELPKHWLRFRAMDWGSSSPFVVGWFAVASEDFSHPDDRIIPKNALVQYREWYGGHRANVGLKMFAEDVARGITAREVGDDLAYGVIDPSALAQDGGPSILERMQLAGSTKWGPADNARTGRLGHAVGWDLVRMRLQGEHDGPPMAFLFSTCPDTARTLSALQHHKNKPEDAQDDGDDHAADMFRYACASRPWIKPAPNVMPPLTTLKDVTMAKLWKMKPTHAGRI